MWMRCTVRAVYRGQLRRMSVLPELSRGPRPGSRVDTRPGRGPLRLAVGPCLEQLAADDDRAQADEDLADRHQEQGDDPGLSAGDVVRGGEAGQVRGAGGVRGPHREAEAEAHADDPEGGGATGGLDEHVPVGVPDAGEQTSGEAENDPGDGEDRGQRYVVAGGRD